MVSALLIGVGLIVATPVSGPSSPEDLAAYESAKGKVGRDPDAHVKLALWCEAHGLQAEGIKHLAIAVLTDPAHATARGLMGLVAYCGHWQRPEDVSRAIKADQALAEYNARRENSPNTADGHWKLAIWCEEKGLKAESIAHLTALTRLDPSRDAAWKRLGCKKVNGQWLSETRLAALRVEGERQKQADRHWKPLLEKWRGRLSEKGRQAGAEKALADVTDPRAVPAVWTVFATGDANQQIIATRVFGQIDAATSSRALAALATTGKSAEVRRVALETLKRRDPRDFLSHLIAMVRTPIKYEVRAVNGPGSTGVLFVEGKRYDVRRLYASTAIPLDLSAYRLFAPSVPFDPFGPENTWMAIGSPGESRAPLPTSAIREIAAHPENAGRILARIGGVQDGPVVSVNNFVLSGMTRAARRDMQLGNLMRIYQQGADEAQARLARDVAELDAANVAIRGTNDVVLPALNALTGQDLGADEDSWRAWWTDQQGYKYDATDSETPKPTLTQVVPPPALALPHSCFGAGTLVRTRDGRRPIESIRVGDLALSQNTRTGALSFAPVVAVFHNKPATTLRIDLDGEATIATGIHRFWKAGQGWTMARDLKPGDRVRTLGGVARVVSVETAELQPVFNLEVAEGQSFFVGDRGALVHDNSLVEATPEPFDGSPSLAAAAIAAATPAK